MAVVAARNQLERMGSHISWGLPEGAMDTFRSITFLSLFSLLTVACTSKALQPTAASIVIGTPMVSARATPER